MKDVIENKVAKSGLVTLSLEDIIPQGERVIYDIKQNLWQGMVLKEKEFRAFVKEHDWSRYQDKYVGLTCSEDAIVPSWAYMLLAVNLEPYAKKVVYGNQVDLERTLIREGIDAIDPEDYKDARIVIKGCGRVEESDFAFVELTNKLKPVVRMIMYGEPCSTVPVYKRPRKK